MPAPNQNNSRRDIALAALSTVKPTPGVSKPDPIIVADNVVRKFGGLTAVNVGHLEIQRGAITALIGPNGAGKTTFFNLLTGFDQVDDLRRLAVIGGHREVAGVGAVVGDAHLPVDEADHPRPAAGGRS